MQPAPGSRLIRHARTRRHTAHRRAYTIAVLSGVLAGVVLSFASIGFGAYLAVIVHS